MRRQGLALLAMLACAALAVPALAAPVMHIDPGRSIAPSNVEMTITTLDIGGQLVAIAQADLGNRPADGATLTPVNASTNFPAGAAAT